MPDHRRDTGTSATLIIRDYGNNVEFLIENRSGSTFANGKSWSGTINGTNVGGTYSISGAQTISVGMWWVGSSQTVSFGIGASNTSGLGGPTSFSADIPRGTPPPVNTLPSQPPLPVFQSATQATLTFGIGNPATWGTGTPLTFEHQVAIDDFVTILQQWQWGSSPVVVGGLAAGQAYRYRYRALSTVGAGAWSYGLMATTLPTTPPGMVVTPDISGQTATVALTPPSGFSGVTSYTVEHRPQGSSTATQVTGTTPILVSGLTPGSTNEWRARANFGSIPTDWTTWQTVFQPNPNTNPGDYFDGSTPPKGDVSYSWTGTANNSTSQATAQGVAGWMSFLDGNPSVGANGVLARVTAGLFGQYAARITFLTDQTVAGFAAGTNYADPGRTDVTPGATYVGSIHVNTSKGNRLRARLAWISAAGAIIGTSDGDASLVAVNTWTRLMVTGMAPAGAEWAAIWWISSTGDGYSHFLSGDTVTMDGAMITLSSPFPYFDGDTPDSADFVYAWEGGANQSESTRTAAGAGGPSPVASSSAYDPLQDPDCVVPPDPPRPPTVPTDCIDEVGVWRRYYATIPSTEVNDWQSVLLTLAIHTGASAVRQIRVRVYPNPFDYPPSEINTDEWCSEQIISYVPPQTIFTLDGVTQRAWAEVQGGASVGADHLLFGSGGTPATWPVLSCGISYLASFEVPIESPEGNIVVQPYLTTRA